MAHRIPRLRGMLIIDTAVAQPPFGTKTPKEYSSPSSVTTRLCKLRADTLRALKPVSAFTRRGRQKLQAVRVLT